MRHSFAFTLTLAIALSGSFAMPAFAHDGPQSVKLVKASGEPEWRRVWAATEAAATGPVVIANRDVHWRRYTIKRLGDGPEGLMMDMTLRPHTRGWQNEYLVGGRVKGTDRYVFQGIERTPGPDDGPVSRSVAYDLRYMSAEDLLVGTRTVANGTPKAVVLAPAKVAPGADE